MLIKVEVTQEDIDKGEPKKCKRCPVALALLRCVPGVDTVVVDYGTLAGDRDDGSLLFDVRMPTEVAEFVAAFDNQRDRTKPRPFSFDLEVP